MMLPHEGDGVTPLREDCGAMPLGAGGGGAMPSGARYGGVMLPRGDDGARLLEGGGGTMPSGARTAV